MVCTHWLRQSYVCAEAEKYEHTWQRCTSHVYICIYIYHKVWDKVIFLFPNSTVQPLKFWNVWIISRTLYWACNYSSMLGLKLIHVTKRGSNHKRVHHSSLIFNRIIHDDVIMWRYFLRYCSPVGSLKLVGQWREAELWSFHWCASEQTTEKNSPHAGDLRRDGAHCGVTVIISDYVFRQ